MFEVRYLRPLLVALAVAGAVGGAAGARAGTLPQAQTQGAVTYLSGGIGKDEARAIESAAAQWPLMLEFAVHERSPQHDALLANVAVRIVDHRQAVVLDTTGVGPLLLARLQPGRYEVKATFAGTTLTRKLSVTGKGPLREVFLWPHRAEKAAG